MALAVARTIYGSQLCFGPYTVLAWTETVHKLHIA